MAFILSPVAQGVYILPTANLPHMQAPLPRVSSLICADSYLSFMAQLTCHLPQEAFGPLHTVPL